MKKIFFCFCYLLFLSCPTWSVEKISSIKVQSVKELNQDMNKFEDKRVTVRGRVERVIDEYSLVIESGGLINDEIVVSGSSPIKKEALKEDQLIEVTGFYRTVPVVDVQRKKAETFGSPVRKNLEGISTMIMQEKIKLL